MVLFPDLPAREYVDSILAEGIDINADGEFQAAAKLSEAAKLISENPAAIQLRYLQTIREIGVSDKNSTIIPIPMEMFRNVFQNHKE
jgi:regulator of protease activity HflC (stomatin/prohibitin superfamily)